MAEDMKLIKGSRPPAEDKLRSKAKAAGARVPKAKTVVDEPIAQHKREHKRLDKMKGRKGGRGMNRR